jgi:hypothetical protein
VSAVADPNNTGIAVYDAGWRVLGGTSAAAPIIAATFALSGTPRATDNPASYLYANAAYLRDITSGSNGSCGGSLCHAGPGWDGPTGLGTPIAVEAFAWYPPIRLSIPSQTTTLNVPVNLNLNAFVSGGVAPYHWWPGLFDAALPPGLSIGRDTGIITGAPTAPGTYRVAIEVGDTSQTFGFFETAFTWTVAMPLVSVPNIVGMGRTTAGQALSAVGLSFGNERDLVVPACGDDIGKILEQSPGPGTVVSMGSAVNYTLGVKPSGRVVCQ